MEPTQGPSKNILIWGNHLQKQGNTIDSCRKASESLKNKEAEVAAKKRALTS